MRAFMMATVLTLTLLIAGCSSHVRLRGSTEIHESGCRKVRNADPSGVVDADLDDGVPCIECMHDEAIEYHEDNR